MEGVVELVIADIWNGPKLYSLVERLSTSGFCKALLLVFWLRFLSFSLQLLSGVHVLIIEKGLNFSCFSPFHWGRFVLELSNKINASMIVSTFLMLQMKFIEIGFNEVRAVVFQWNAKK